ncbi:uncharacterized protein BBA_06565 [Beauveria bassiana ARSEF 2860]|uniref:Uncharacterized protein n=1 Tax=Beauveria bassiana (strain ARSEF 2860) TaxID=655819 RepID=J5JNJ0_BEAB2|nr:uncharacterized protein BBA_06565 [Beauveria bassiana ARSEF 2860]EJP64571.1 hypothetical protein BBA_06565 [Beauveria bassiana ARSEF 2860]
MLKLLLLVSLSLTLAAARDCPVRAYTNDPVDWQYGSCYRGTWTIVSSCLTTVIACTWTIQHLNIPASTDGSLKKFRRKLKWMLITVLFPEIILVHAGFQFRMAWKALQELESYGQEVKWPWYKRSWRWVRKTWPWYKSSWTWLRKKWSSLREKWPSPKGSWKWLRSQFRQKLADEERGKETQEDPDHSNKWTMTHCYYANMGGFLYDNGSQRFRLTAGELTSLRNRPPIPKEDIQDKSKQDWLAKTWAGLQILQLIFSVITRHIQHTPFSQLEMVTLSFALCGVVIYITNIHKPQNIDRATELKENLTGVEGAILVPSTIQTQDSLWAILSNQRNHAAIDIGSKVDAPRVPNDSIPFDSSNNVVHPVVYPLAGASAIFGLIHAIAWSFEFPTPEEKLLWRIATGISAASPVLGLLTIPLVQSTKSAGNSELFVAHFLRLLREYRWHCPREYPIATAIDELETQSIHLLGPHRQYLKYAVEYSRIFEVDSMGTSPFLLDVGDFLLLRGPYEDVNNRLPSESGDGRCQDHKGNANRLKLHDDKEFIRNFNRLVEALLPRGGKKLKQETQADIWPRKPVFPPFLNDLILYGTSVLYCLSRLALLGVALSSLRKMPGKVYEETDWTKYVPSFGATG